nr:NAD/NADP octopine/nopaline dehydrogenase family protein [uncultured Dethiosulfovibrio sp.]
METKRFAVLGSGNGARAFCGQIAAKGYQVTMWEPLEATEDYLKLKDNPEMFLSGDINLGGKLSLVTMDISEAMEGADVILVVVPSFAHEPIFRKMIPNLQDGQHIVMVPGNFSGFRLKKMMKKMGVSREISISGTTSMPYACRISSYNTVSIYKKKFAMKLGTSPVSQNTEVLNILNDVFEGYVNFIAAESLLEVDLDNPNYVVHPFPVLFNFGDIEKNGSTYRHYIDGITPMISEFMERMDEERLMIGKTLGLTLQDCLSQLKMYYGENQSKNIYEFVHSPESPYFDLVGQNVKGRYLTEDVPGVVLPAKLLAEKAGVKAPIADLVVETTSFVHNVDYLSKGTTLDTLGIEDKNIEEIKALAL